MLSVKCAVCDSKKSRCIKERKCSGLFKNLGTVFGSSGNFFGTVLADNPLF